MKSFLKVFLIIILSMGVAGGGTYYFLNSSYNDKLGSLESQLSEAQRAVDYYSNLASSVSAEEIAGWSTYTNDTAIR
jgi:flagellar basal body-associated protein FliL